jgi:uncharacterized membrane protein
MNTLKLTQLGLGLIGVFVAVQGVVAFPGLSAAAALVAGEYGSGAAVVTVLLPFLLIWVVCYYLVFANLGLAKLLSEKAESVPESVVSSDTARILVGLAGVLVVAYSLPGVITSVRVFLELGSFSAEREFWRVTVAYLAQAVMGVFLVLRPDVLLKLWDRAGG